MSTSSPPLPVRREATRPASFAKTLLAHERLLAFVSALLCAALAFEPRIRAGGLLSDDWTLYVAVKFPGATGFHSAWSALGSLAGSRIGAVPYWLLSYTLFGSHTRLYALLAAGLAAMMAFSFYLLLRELKFATLVSLAIMALIIVAPSADTVRFWFTPSGSQLCLTLFFLGLTLALRAFSAPPRRRLYLHGASWALYLASALYAEVALPLIAVSVLVYLTRAGLLASLRRWALDMLVVIGGYVGTLVFVNAHSGFEPPAATFWSEHAQQLGDQALTIFTRMLVPLSDSARSGVVVGLGILALACTWLWRRAGTDARVRAELQRWSAIFGISIAATLASYIVYVPASFYYDPLSPGLASRINIAAVAPLATSLVAVLMLAKVALGELLKAFAPHTWRIDTALVAVWLAVIVANAIGNVRHDAHIWALATARGGDELRVLTTRLPHPLRNSTVYTFGEGGSIVLGVPIFLSPWELTNAVKIDYRRSDVSGYPVVTDWDRLQCDKNGVTLYIGATAANAPSPYRETYFFNVPSGYYERIDNVRTCNAGLASFHPGPYTDTPLEWSI